MGNPKTLTTLRNLIREWVTGSPRCTGPVSGMLGDKTATSAIKGQRHVRGWSVSAGKHRFSSVTARAQRSSENHVPRQWGGRGPEARVWAP